MPLVNADASCGFRNGRSDLPQRRTALQHSPETSSCPAGSRSRPKDYPIQRAYDLIELRTLVRILLATILRNRLGPLHRPNENLSFVQGPRGPTAQREDGKTIAQEPTRHQGTSAQQKTPPRGGVFAWSRALLLARVPEALPLARVGVVPAIARTGRRARPIGGGCRDHPQCRAGCDRAAHRPPVRPRARPRAAAIDVAATIEAARRLRRPRPHARRPRVRRHACDANASDAHARARRHVRRRRGPRPRARRRAVALKSSLNCRLRLSPAASWSRYSRWRALSRRATTRARILHSRHTL